MKSSVASVAMAATVAMAAIWISTASPALAQEDESNPTHWELGLSLENIHFNGTYAGEEFRAGSWSPDGAVVRYIARGPSGEGTDIVELDLEKDSRRVVLQGSRLFASDVGRLIEIHDYAFNEAGNKVLIFTDSEPVWRAATKGFYYLFDVDTGDLKPISERRSGYQMFAKLSPDESRIAFVRNRNLFVLNLETGVETTLTWDGSEGGIINGTFDWVYEEEFGLRDGWSWSPDGSKISFFKLDESDTRDFAMTDLRNQYPDYVSFRYPKAGEKNSRIQIGIADVSSGEITYLETNTWGEEENSSSEYIARMGWTPAIEGESQVWMMRLDRDQNDLDLLFASAENREVRTVLSESEKTWIEVSDQKLTFLEDGNHFVWQSEVDGYRHLYLYKNDGELRAQITSGEWDVTQFHGIDEENSTAYFTAAIESSTERQLYGIQVDLAGGDSNVHLSSPWKITNEDGVHTINMSADLSFFIDKHSSAASPPVWTLNATRGASSKMLEENKKLRKILPLLNLPQPEFIQVLGESGVSLNAYLIKPADFDATKSYPLLMYVYGGPGSQTVMNSWGSTTFLWHVFLANELDLIVASVDNRGTGGRGKKFKSDTYQKIGQLEALDQISAAQQFGSLSYIDAERIGIWGWSYGGYMTLMSMLYGEGPETFKLGVAVAPVSDWRLYDTIYTERYMSTPQRNPLGYKRGAPTNYASRLGEHQKLLIMHGDFDDNVHFQNTVQMVDALQAANKQFDLMIYPGKNHSIRGGHTRLNLFTKATEYIRKNL